MDSIGVIVPAYEEEGRIGDAIRELRSEYDVLVIDDGSTDDTASEAREAGAVVVERPSNEGYAAALRRGFREVSNDVVVTYDADGEHRPADVERVVGPVVDGEFDMVLGRRRVVPRRSERLLNALVRSSVGVSDAYTGLRAIDRDLVTELALERVSNCGTLVLEAAANGATIGEVTVETRRVSKPRGIAWEHWRHCCQVLGRAYLPR